MVSRKHATPHTTARTAETGGQTRNLLLIAAISLCFGSLVTIGVFHFYWASIRSAEAEAAPNIRKPTEDKFISPLLLCSEQRSLLGGRTISGPLEKYIADAKARGDATNVSYYYRDLVSGRWSSSTDGKRYAPASLMKVPILIAILKESESDPTLLSHKITFTDKLDEDDMEHFKPAEHPVLGRTYTVEELLKYMAEYSDNNATVMLLSVLPDEQLGEVYADLSLPAPSDANGASDFMTPQLYSRLFRVLYNATYLNEANSEKALELLANRDFDALTTNIPSGVVVSHKYGERTVNDNGVLDHRELHDCGIVYAKNDPYALCVMTEGLDFDKLKKVISDVSGIVYKDVTTQK